MNKQEKYINYIVEDLVKKTEIDYEQRRIIYPFLHPLLKLPLLPLSFIFFPSFSNNLKEKYGVHDEEVEIIWSLYKERILSLIEK